MVANAKGTVNTASTVTCSVGGLSVPIVVSSSVSPHTDVTVKLEKRNTLTNSDNTTTELSEGLTAGAETVTLTVSVPTGVLGFECASTLNSTVTPLLNYTMGGTNMDSFTLSSAAVTANVVAASA